MARVSGNPNFADCLTVGEAAEFLGVSPATLRNWDRSGKLKPRRHPQNGYRIYLHEDLQAVLSSADLATAGAASAAPQVDWAAMGEAEHFVQFYETDEYLVESVSGYVSAALSAGAASAVLATRAHRLALQQKLAAQGVNISEVIESGRYVVLDASDALTKFMVDGAPDAGRFQETIGTLIGQLAQGGRRVHAFGEMVALLWADGNREAAIRLEQLWNDLAKQYRFALFCAYQITAFDEVDDEEPFDGVCGCHSRVIPAESYAAIDNADQRLRAIGRLQQKARALGAEREHRQEVEKALVQREHALADSLARANGDTQDAAADGESLTTPPKQRVLVVDDNQDSCRTLSLLLQAKGRDVRAAHDGLAALDLVPEFRPEVILMDVGMPKLNGYEATRRIRQMPAGKNAFIVALTGWGRASDRQQALDAGCSAHLVKPVDFAALDQLLANVTRTF